MIKNSIMRESAASLVAWEDVMEDNQALFLVFAADFAGSTEPSDESK